MDMSQTREATSSLERSIKEIEQEIDCLRRGISSYSWRKFCDEELVPEALRLMVGAFNQGFRWAHFCHKIEDRQLLTRIGNQMTIDAMTAVGFFDENMPFHPQTWLTANRKRVVTWT